MPYFFDTTETIPDGLGFEPFGLLHMIWIIIMIVVLVLGSWFYRSLDEKKRRYMRNTVAGLIVADEVFKQVCLLIGGNWEPQYLPLHLCSINIFLIALHAITNSKLLENFIYMFAMTTAPLAVLFATWTRLPLGNFMHLHSFTIHILLTLYPIMLLVGRDLRRDRKMVPKCIVLFLVIVAVAYIVNITMGTNFLFIMHTESVNPLTFFENHFGSTMVAYPFSIAAGYLVLYVIPDRIIAKRAK